MLIAAMGAQAALVYVYGDKKKNKKKVLSFLGWKRPLSHLIASSFNLVELSQYNTV